VNRLQRALVLLFFFASGASGLVYEVLWVRQFGVLFGSTVYSAALVTGLYMCGLGLGSWLAGRYADRRHAIDPSAPLRAYAGFELAIAALAAGMLLALPAVADLSLAVSS
jgi:spermidine synthase